DAVVPLGLDLAALNISIAPSLELSGPDVAFHRGIPEDDHDDIGPDTDLSALIDRLVAQMSLDIIQISPNLKSRLDPSYTTLSIDQQHAVTIDLYKSLVLPFTGVWFRTSNSKHWDLQFDRFFPGYDKQLDKLQNFPSCRYFQLWLRLRTQMRKPAFEALRAKLRVPFRDLSWLPYTDSDRMWDT
ncbi:hypothetical protein C2E23DRAFT_693034, partial [Lenzites betulinus]